MKPMVLFENLYFNATITLDTWAFPIGIYFGGAHVDVTILCFTFRYVRWLK